MSGIDKINPAQIEKDLEKVDQDSLISVLIEIGKNYEKNLNIIRNLREKARKSGLERDRKMAYTVEREAQKYYKELFQQLNKKLQEASTDSLLIGKLKDFERIFLIRLKELETHNEIDSPQSFDNFLNSPDGKNWLINNEGKLLSSLANPERVMVLDSMDTQGRKGVGEFLDSILNDSRKIESVGTVTLVFAGSIIVGTTLGALTVGRALGSAAFNVGADVGGGMGIVVGTGGTLLGTVIGGYAGAQVGGAVGLSYATYELVEGVVNFDDVVASKDPITGLEYSEEDTFALIKGVADSIAVNSKDWKVRDNMVMANTGAYISHLIDYESNDAIDPGNMTKADVIDATAKHIGIPAANLRKINKQLMHTLETVLGSDKVQKGNSIKSYKVAALEGKLLGKIVSSYQEFKGQASKISTYTNYVLYRLNNLPSSDMELDAIADSVLPPSQWEDEAILLLSNQEKKG